MKNYGRISEVYEFLNVVTADKTHTESRVPH